jgi:excinuclease UvrABC nuclease subunit
MKLLRHFGSLERVHEAPEEDLARVAGRAAARKLKQFKSSETELMPSE